MYVVWKLALFLKWDFLPLASNSSFYFCWFLQIILYPKEIVHLYETPEWTWMSFKWHEYLEKIHQVLCVNKIDLGAGSAA